MQAWMDTLHAMHVPLALLYWHTPHTAPTHPLLTTAAALVEANPTLMRLCCVDVHTHARNQAFGFNGRVVRYPDSHRRGARTRPVLACGHPFPAVSVHDVPAVHPTRLHAGLDAASALLAHLRALHPSLVVVANPAAMACMAPLLPVPRNTAVQLLSQGAGQLKRMMHAAAAAGTPLVVLWLHGGTLDSEGTRAAQDVVYGLPRVGGVAVAEADAAVSANRMVASRLGVTAYPALQVFYNMALQATIACGADGALLAGRVQRVLGKLAPQKEVEVAAPEESFQPPGDGKTVARFAGGMIGMMAVSGGVCHHRQRLMQVTFTPRCRACCVGAPGGWGRIGTHAARAVGGTARRMGMTTTASPSPSMLPSGASFARK